MKRSYKLISNLPKSIVEISGPMLTQLHAPEPEGLYTRGLRIVNSQANTLGWFPMLSLVCGLGLLVVAGAFDISLSGGTALELEISFMAGLLLIFIPVLARLISAAPGRFERLCLLCFVGICFYLIEVMSSPLHFSAFNEFLHWRTAIDIAATNHLFTPNSMLPVSSYYPGLEIITNELSTMSGLSIFHAGLIVIGVARLVMILSLFLLYEQITGSARMASIGVMIYMTNLHFVFFDAQYSYESLALPLATFMLYTLARYQKLYKNCHWVILATVIVLGAIIVTHHVTDYVFIGLLGFWTVTSIFQRDAGYLQKKLAIITLFAIFTSLAYAFLLKGNPVWQYLSEYFGQAFNELDHIITGTRAARPLFSNRTGLTTPIWDKLLMIANVGLVSTSIPFGLLSLLHQYRHKSLSLMFGIVSLFYPISQVFLFTELGPDITSRSAAFLFLPVSYVLTILITQLCPTRKPNWRTNSLAICVLAVIFLGGILLDSGPSWSNLPGHYFVVDDSRSIEPEGIQAAQWTSSNLGPNNRISTDRINRLLMSTYGNQQMVTTLSDNVDITPVFFASSFGSKEASLLKLARVHYLVIDLRLSTGLPAVGFYFESPGEAGYNLTSPISREALTKFNTVVGINRVFDSGNIIIYDVGELTNAS